MAQYELFRLMHGVAIRLYSILSCTEPFGRSWREVLLLNKNQLICLVAKIFSFTYKFLYYLFFNYRCPGEKP